jgi:site-specific DNA-methyltransferase (adenine-specific)
MNKDTKIQEPQGNGVLPCYRLPFLSLFHADCMEIMKQYPDKYFDLAIVDPPYGINMAKGIEVGKWKRAIHKTKEWDNETPKKEYWDELFRVSKDQIIWGGNYFIEYLKNTSCFIFWDKKNGDNFMSDGELAWTSFKSSVRRFTYNHIQDYNKGIDRIHPTQKPIDLYAFIFMNYATEGMKILDTHFGSGSIALAVDKANRLDKMNLHLTACEIDKEYIDKAIKRISESIKQGTLSF